jgi:Flp pilus assembly protein TadG
MNHNRREQGSNLVEMALGLFILVLFIAAIADFGIALSSYIRITNASREGARIGTRIPQSVTGDTLIRQAVIREGASSGLDLSDTTKARIIIEPALAERAAGQPIAVTVEYTVTTIVAGISGLRELPMRSKTEMMMLEISETNDPNG